MGKKRKRPITQSIADLVAAGKILPGKGLISVVLQGTTYVADLDPAGVICYGSHKFKSPSGFAGNVLGSLGLPSKCNGWCLVRYRDKVLNLIRDRSDLMDWSRDSDRADGYDVRRDGRRVGCRHYEIARAADADWAQGSGSLAALTAQAQAADGKGKGTNSGGSKGGAWARRACLLDDLLSIHRNAAATGGDAPAAAPVPLLHSTQVNLLLQDMVQLAAAADCRFNSLAVPVSEASSGVAIDASKSAPSITGITTKDDDAEHLGGGGAARRDTEAEAREWVGAGLRFASLVHTLATHLLLRRCRRDAMHVTNAPGASAPVDDPHSHGSARRAGSDWGTSLQMPASRAGDAGSGGAGAWAAGWHELLAATDAAVWRLQRLLRPRSCGSSSFDGGGGDDASEAGSNSRSSGSILDAGSKSDACCVFCLESSPGLRQCSACDRQFHAACLVSFESAIGTADAPGSVGTTSAKSHTRCPCCRASFALATAARQADLLSTRRVLDSGLASPLVRVGHTSGSLNNTALHAACHAVADANKKFTPATTDACRDGLALDRALDVLAMLLAFAANADFAQDVVAATKTGSSAGGACATAGVPRLPGRLPALLLLPNKNGCTALDVASASETGLEARMMMSNTFTDTCGNPAVATEPAVPAPTVAEVAEGGPSLPFVQARGAAAVVEGEDAACNRELFAVPWQDCAEGRRGGGCMGAGPPRLSYLRRCVEGPGVHIDWKFETPIESQLKPCRCGLECIGNASDRSGVNDVQACSKAHASSNARADLFECHVLCHCDATASTTASTPGRSHCRARQSQRGGVGGRVRVIRTAKRGWGLAAAERFQRGAYVCQYTGEVITKQEVERREPKYQAAGYASYIFNLSGVSSAQLGGGSALVIDSTHAGNVASYVNHACKGANLEARRVFTSHRDRAMPRVCFFAARDISPGEELTLSYGAAPEPCFCPSCST